MLPQGELDNNRLRFFIKIVNNIGIDNIESVDVDESQLITIYFYNGLKWCGYPENYIYGDNHERS